MTTENMNRYTAIVTIATEDIDNAEQVLNERIYYDEDYGFPYQVNYSELQPEESTRGIVIDASVIRERLDSRMEGIRDDNPNDKRIINAEDRIASMNDGDLNALISSIDNERVWELFDEMCDLILGFVVDETIKTDPS